MVRIICFGEGIRVSIRPLFIQFIDKMTSRQFHGWKLVLAVYLCVACVPNLLDAQCQLLHPNVSVPNL